MILHQADNSIGNDIYSGFLYHDYNWMLHMHKSIEFTLCLRGTLITIVGQKQYEIGPGQMIFVMPYQPHAYIASEDTVFFISCFSKNHIPYFVSEFSNKEPDSSCIDISDDISDYILKIHNISDRHIQNAVRAQVFDKPSMYERKAALYAICGEIAKQCTWHEKERDDDLTFQILSYIEQHFSEKISLLEMADSLSYEYHYLSRVFHATLGTSFSTLVNQYRCEKAHLLLTETKKPISDIALECGFQSIRSFNRIFFEYSGKTPSSIRK